MLGRGRVDAADEAWMPPLAGSDAENDDGMEELPMLAIKDAEPEDHVGDDESRQNWSIVEIPLHTNVIAGYAYVSEIAPLVADAIKDIAVYPKEIDADVYTYISEKVDDTTLLSLVADASKSGLDQRTTRSSRHRWSALFVTWMIARRGALERSICSGALRHAVVHYFEWQRSDATPLRVRVKEHLDKMLELPSDGAGRELQAIGVQGMQNSLQLGSNAGQKKVLQTEQALGFIIRTILGLIAFICDFVTPLLIIESEKAYVMLRAIATTIGTSPCRRQLPHKGRGVCVDGHPSNAKAERLLSAVRSGFHAFLWLCELHLVALVLSEAFKSVLPDTIRGVLHSGLSVGHGDCMNVFRLLYREIVGTLDIMAGRPAPSAVRYRERMLRLFSSSLTSVSLGLAAGPPNGDWRVRHRAQWYPPAEFTGRITAPMKQRIAPFLALGLLKAFVPTVLNLFAVHHWSGLELAVDQMGCLEACRYLMSRTTARFIAYYGTTVAKDKLIVPTANLAALLAPELPIPLADLPAQEPNDAHDTPLDPQLAARVGDKPGEDTWVKMNDTSRRHMGYLLGELPSFVVGRVENGPRAVKASITRKIQVRIVQLGTASTREAGPCS